jgi:hypothetical protein
MGGDAEKEARKEGLLKEKGIEGLDPGVIHRQN